MTYPAGMLTRQVDIAAIHDLESNAIGGQIQVEASVSLKWDATGELFLARPATIFLDTSNGTGSITLPIVQQGFVGPDGAVLATWTYTFTPLLDPNTPVVEPYVLQLGFGDGSPITIDFEDPTPNVPGALLYRPGADGAKGDPGDPGPITNWHPGTPSSLPHGATPIFEFVQAGNDVTVNYAIPDGAPGSNGNAAGVPTGGSANQVLTKKSSTDFDSEWRDNAAQGIPAAGGAGQVLAKTANTDYATGWIDPPTSVPDGGAGGQILTKNSAADQDVGWADPAAQHDLPTGGAINQVLAKASAADRDVRWANPSTGGAALPAGGAPGQVLSKKTSADGDVQWTDPILTINSLPAGTLMVVSRNADGSWPARLTGRNDIHIAWDGAYTGDANEPAIVASGTGGMLDGVDYRWKRAAS